jgi:hypothetical protein
MKIPPKPPKSMGKLPMGKPPMMEKPSSGRPPPFMAQKKPTKSGC